ncbi:Cell division protein ZapB [Buchnera aphidicola (Cinara kochiana kochiana)]|uniref:Cell division protein ZapB n=1 Tax=Buchnera aphidicola (Cinara kochiana kochiana) TaxID=2518976 RepID=A0A451D647_9GAMM|nr:cell division protein ZapB [Buchnera aphidicola]VFP81282.1 Cell division protein ZapB [Buchnera aphidicola (Cinara kochiana kochiana)]
MVLEVFSNLEIQVQKSVDYISLLKLEINNLKLKNNSLKEKLKNIYSLKERIEEKNILIQEERMKWKRKIKSLLEQINNLE